MEFIVLVFEKEGRLGFEGIFKLNCFYIYAWFGLLDFMAYQHL